MQYSYTRNYYLFMLSPNYEFYPAVHTRSIITLTQESDTYHCILPLGSLEGSLEVLRGNVVHDPVSLQCHLVVHVPLLHELHDRAEQQFRGWR
jgi:hypothetical protein